MTRPNRLAIFGGTALVLIAGTALGVQGSGRPGTQGPLTASQEQPEAPPTADDVAHAVDQLKAAGITTTADELKALSADYGLGGAVRLMAWAEATGKSVAALRALRDAGAGWGQLAHDLGVSPGLGSIMGNGGGHGRDDAPGQQEPKPSDGND